MPDYTYRARNRQGNVVLGRASGDSQSQVTERLREQGLFVTEVGLDRDIMQTLRRRAPAGRVSPKELTLLCRQLATMISAGIPIVDAFAALRKQMRSRRMSEALAGVIADVQSGVSLAAALERYPKVFPVIMVSTIAAGEAGGILDEVLERLAVYYEKQDTLRQKIRNSLIYPAAVVAVAVVAAAFLLVFVLPTFAELFAELQADLPGPTRVLIGLSRWAVRFWFIPLFGLGLLVSAFAAFRSTPRGALLLDRAVLAVPVLGEMVAKQALARFSRTLSTLLRGGVPILSALAVLEPVMGNRVFATAVRDAEETVRDGQSLSRSLKTQGVFPSMMLEMITTGERAGALEEMLLRIADFYETDLDRLANRVTAVIEPILIVGLGIVVGGIIIAVVLPMFDIFTKIPN